jgi:flagellar hook-associated protein 3 FlgL
VDSNLPSASFADGPTNTFTAASVTMSRQIGHGAPLDINVIGSAFLPMFSDIKKLADTLSSPTGQQSDINAAITNMDSAMDVVLTNRTDVGAKLNRLDAVKSRLADQGVELTRIKSNAEDLDLASAMTELTTDQGVYQASLATSARIGQLSLMDFLR